MTFPGPADGCHNCAACSDPLDISGVSSGICRRRAPLPMVPLLHVDRGPDDGVERFWTTEQFIGKHNGARWPIVSLDDGSWCCEWLPKQRNSSTPKKKDRREKPSKASIPKDLAAAIILLRAARGGDGDEWHDRRDRLLRIYGGDQ